MTNIEWTHAPGFIGATWNPVIGCRHVAEGCRHCYAETMSKRLAAMGQKDYASILDAKGKFNGKAITRPETLAEPLHWKKPRAVFVNSMSDLFHEDVPFEFIAAVVGVMAACPQHTFQVLTKRPERALEFFQWLRAMETDKFCARTKCDMEARRLGAFETHGGNTLARMGVRWPAENVWLGVSIATQADADKNIPVLLKCPAAVHFVSAEPLIENVNLGALRIKEEDPCVTLDAMTGVVNVPTDKRTEQFLSYPRIGWVIVGGESGPGARPCDAAWIRSIIAQCKAAGVPCFVKQLGAAPELNYYDEDDAWREWAAEHDGDDHVDYSFQPALSEKFYPKLKDRKGGDPTEWPKDLRVREFPKTEIGA